MSMGIHLESIKVYVTECNMFSKTLPHISTANTYKRLGPEEVRSCLIIAILYSLFAPCLGFQLVGTQVAGESLLLTCNQKH